MSTFREDRDLWWAYLDGELTPAESAELDRSLAPDERERLVRDALLESELGEILSAPVTCPDTAWKTALQQIKAAGRPKRSASVKKHLKRSLLFGLPLTASVVVAMGAFLSFHASPDVQKAWFLDANDHETAAPRDSNGPADVRELLQQQNVQLVFDPSNSLDEDDAPYRLLGSREDKFHDQSVVELFFDCEGVPAKVIIAPQGGAAADQLGRAWARGAVRSSRSIGNSLVAVLGDKAPRDLVKVLEDPLAPKAAPPAEQPAVEEPAAPDTQLQDAVQDAPPPPEETPSVPVNEDATPTVPYETGASTVV